MTLDEWTVAVKAIGALTIIGQAFVGCFPGATHEAIWLGGALGACIGTALVNW